MRKHGTPVRVFLWSLLQAPDQTGSPVPLFLKVSLWKCPASVQRHSREGANEKQQSLLRLLILQEEEQLQWVRDTEDSCQPKGTAGSSKETEKCGL